MNNNIIHNSVVVKFSKKTITLKEVLNKLSPYNFTRYREIKFEDDTVTAVMAFDSNGKEDVLNANFDLIDISEYIPERLILCSKGHHFCGKCHMNVYCAMTDTNINKIYRGLMNKVHSKYGKGGSKSKVYEWKSGAMIRHGKKLRLQFMRMYGTKVKFGCDYSNSVELIGLLSSNDIIGIEFPRDLSNSFYFFVEFQTIGHVVALFEQYKKGIKLDNGYNVHFTKYVQMKEHENCQRLNTLHKCYDCKLNIRSTLSYDRISAIEMKRSGREVSKGKVVFPKSPKTPKSQKAPWSTKTLKSPKSPKSLKSPKSPKSLKSPKSPKTLKSPKKDVPKETPKEGVPKEKGLQENMIIIQKERKMVKQEREKIQKEHKKLEEEKKTFMEEKIMFNEEKKIFFEEKIIFNAEKKEFKEKGSGGDSPHMKPREVTFNPEWKNFMDVFKVMQEVGNSSREMRRVNQYHQPVEYGMQFQQGPPPPFGYTYPKGYPNGYPNDYPNGYPKKSKNRNREF